MLASCRSISWLSPCLHLIRHLTWVEDEAKHSRDKEEGNLAEMIAYFQSSSPEPMFYLHSRAPVVTRCKHLNLMTMGVLSSAASTALCLSNFFLFHCAIMSLYNCLSNCSIVISKIHLHSASVTLLIYLNFIPLETSHWHHCHKTLEGRVPFFWEKKSDHFIAKKPCDASVSIQKNNTDSIINWQKFIFISLGLEGSRPML